MSFWPWGFALKGCIGATGSLRWTQKMPNTPTSRAWCHIQHPCHNIAVVVVHSTGNPSSPTPPSPPAAGACPSSLDGEEEGEEEEGLNPGRVCSLSQSRVSTNNNSQSKLRTNCGLLKPVWAGGKQQAAHTDPGVEHTTYIQTERILTFDLAERRR